MRGGRTGSGLVALGALCLAAIGATGAVALQDGGTSDDALVDRLVAIESQLPPLPPTGVGLEDDTTWGTVEGDFTGARVTLDTVEEQLRQLFVEGDEADSDVAAAVSDVARAYLDLREGYGYLSEWETADLSLPIDARDEEGVATGADERRGYAEAGLTLVLDANERLVPAYEILRDTAAADDQEQARFDARYRDTVAFESSMRPQLLELLSRQTSKVIRATDRFGSAAPGQDARARSLTVICLDRDVYESADPATTPLDPALILEQVPAADCPDLPNDNVVTGGAG